MRALGTLSLLGLLAAAPALAQEDTFCARIENTARAIMEHRQNGGMPTSIIKANPTDILLWHMISSAYKVPLTDTQARRDRAIQHFTHTQAQELGCFQPLDIPPTN